MNMVCVPQDYQFMIDSLDFSKISAYTKSFGVVLADLKVTWPVVVGSIGIAFLIG